MADDDSDDYYDNVRDPRSLGPFIGRTLVDVTQDDPEDVVAGSNRIYLHFDNGAIVSFTIGDEGFEIETIDDE